MSFDETETVGIPIAPIMGWNNFHFFYWWGCRRNEIEFTNKRWIERGETIMTLKEMKIPSPFSGYVVNEQASPLYDSKHTYDRINVSKHYVCGPCFMMKIQKTAYIENIGWIYEDVFDYILKEVREYGPGTVKGAIDGLMGKFLNLGNYLDPKKRFDSHENFLEKAQDLMNVKAVKLQSS